MPKDKTDQTRPQGPAEKAKAKGKAKAKAKGAKAIGLRLNNVEPHKIRAIQDKTRQQHQGNENAITPQTKMRAVLPFVRSSVRKVMLETNVVHVLQHNATEGNVEQRLQQRLDDLDKEPKIIGEGAGKTWANGVDAFGPLVYHLFDLQIKQSGSTVLANHRDKVKDTMTKVISQVRLVESHLMKTYGLRPDQYKGAFMTAEKLLSNLSREMEVLRLHVFALQNTSFDKTLVEFFCDVPKVQLFEAFENLNRNLVKELELADKYAKDIINLFKVADLDRNKLISKEELSQMFSRFSLWTPEQLDQLFIQADVNHDDFLNYDEFVRWIFSEDELLVDAAEHYAVTMALFKKYDKDCSGFISAKELQAFFAEQEGQKIKLTKAKEYVLQLDTNGDKKVDCFEFIQYLNWKENDACEDQ